MTNFIRAYESHERLIDDISGLKDARNSQELKSLLIKIQNACRIKWSTFNLTLCILGLLNLAFSILNLYHFLSFKSDTNVNLKFVLISFCIYFILGLITSNFQNIWIYTFLVNIYFSQKIYKSIIFNIKQINIENFILILTFILPFSNSFIIKENNSIRFLLISVLFYRIYLNRKKKLPIFKLLICLVLIRICSVFYVCREELNDSCSQSIFAQQMSKSSLSTTKYTLFYLFNFISIFLIFYFLKTKNLILNVLLSASLIILMAYNFVQLLGRDSTMVKYPQLMLARLFLLVFVLQLTSACAATKKFFKSDLFNFLKLCIVIFISLLLGDSLLSVWILALILHLASDGNQILYSKIINYLILKI